MTDDGKLEVTCHFKRVDVGDWTRRTAVPQLQSIRQQAERFIAEKRQKLVSARIGQQSFELIASTLIDLNYESVRKCSEAFAILKGIVGREVH
jgi:hypothetical protein